MGSGGLSMPAKHSDALPREKVLVLYQRLTLDIRKHFQADIARDLECSPQTVSRLVDLIERHIGKDSHIEKGLEGRRRYYRLCTKSQDKALGISSEELHFLAVCRDLAAPYLPESVFDRIGHSLTQLALTLGEQSVPDLPLGFRSKGYIDYTPHLGTISCLRTAMEKRQVCRVIYTAAGRNEPSVYRYAPGRILVMGGAMYVQGYRLVDGMLAPERPTTFSLHRISDIATTGEFFGFDAAEGGARRFGLDWHEPKRMSVKVAKDAADYVRDRIWSDDQVIKNHRDGSLTLTVTTTSERELQAWVWSFGGLARVLNSTT